MYRHTNLEEIETRQMSQMTLFLKDGIYINLVKIKKTKKEKTIESIANTDSSYINDRYRLFTHYS